MGLGYYDGFPPAPVFWEHWCRGEADIISTEKKYPCNWCGMEEEDLKNDSKHHYRERGLELF